MGVFGLLLGIDDYKCPTVANLSGAGADVEAVLELFCDTLHAPKDNFTVLINQLATRKAIIDALISLRDDDRIKLGDAIIIYLAGHGGMIPAPPGWEAGGKGANIKVIIPHDYCVTSGEEVRAIPDRTIGALLECIAEEKGNNIVRISIHDWLLFVHFFCLFRPSFLTAATLVRAPERKLMADVSASRW